MARGDVAGELLVQRADAVPFDEYARADTREHEHDHEHDEHDHDHETPGEL